MDLGLNPSKRQRDPELYGDSEKAKTQNHNQGEPKRPNPESSRVKDQGTFRLRPPPTCIQVWTNSSCSDTCRRAAEGAEPAGPASWMQNSCWPLFKLHLLREPSAANERQWAELSMIFTDKMAAIRTRQTGSSRHGPT